MDACDIRARVEELIGFLIGAVRTGNVYGRDHNLTKDAIDKLYSSLRAALSDREEITIGIIGDEVAFEKMPFYEISKNMGKFILQLKTMKIEKISFLQNCEKRELAVFINALAGSIKHHGKDSGIEKALEAGTVKNILVGTIGFGKEPEEPASEINARAQTNASFQEGIDFLKQTLDDISNNRPVNIRAARFVINKIVGSLLKNMHSLLMLISLKKHDEYTFVHSLNVAIFTLVQAEALGLPEGLLTDIGIAALLHDIGKLSVEADIIKKSGKLNQEEIEKMHLHPIAGAEILLETPDVPLVAAVSTFEHHMKYDMQGYPARLYGDKLNLASMMIAIADAYDAMRTKRSYHEAFAAEKVYEEMIKSSGKNFHPDLLDIFFKRIGIYPPGTLVELDDNAVGLVVKANIVDTKRPQVEMLYNSKGEEEKETYIINLLEKDETTKEYKRAIVKSIPISDKHNIPAKYKTE
ncbi:MAG: HD-GYP domain-containing protein [Candidatus Omnitrophota bacterium]|nr:HD-GYP domain-containing protein [Candidatus Omnitrophota bacterium]